MLIVPAAAWCAQPEAVLPLLELCDQHRCRVVLDDFELNEAALLLLQSKAIRMLKLSAELTTEAMRERFPRALLSACTHIARVLGIHCIAKRVRERLGRPLAGGGGRRLPGSLQSRRNRRCHHDRRGGGAAAGFVIVAGGRAAAVGATRLWP